MGNEISVEGGNEQVLPGLDMQSEQDAFFVSSPVCFFVYVMFNMH